MKVNDIVFSLCVFDMGWHEWLWVSIYKGVELRSVRGENAELKCEKFCMYVWGMKNLETLNQRIQRLFIV